MVLLSSTYGLRRDKLEEGYPWHTNAVDVISFSGRWLAGALPVAGFGIVPSLRTLGYKSPNEKLNIASIGAGGKASGDIFVCSHENIVALCDVDEERAARKFKQYEKVPKYRDFRRTSVLELMVPGTGSPVFRTPR